MKRLLICALLFALLLSLCVATVSALTVEEIEAVRSFGFYPAEYSGSAEDFSSPGTVKITWDMQASEKLDLTDGAMIDWKNADYNTVTLTADNMVNWGGLNQVPEGWSIDMYFVADSDNLYIGFDITDPAFAYGSGSSYDGDVIQLAIDFNALISKQLAIDPEGVGDPKNIFYSFSCAADGEPLMIMRQESDRDGWLTKKDGVVGSAAKTESGWCAEFSMSFDRLFEDYAWEAWVGDAKVYMGSDDRRPMNIACCLYYVDRSETAGAINWAAGSTNGITYADGTPAVSWTAWDNGICLELDYVEGMSFTCENIIVIPHHDLDEITTEAYEEGTTAPLEFPTEPATEPYDEGHHPITTTPWWEETTYEPEEETASGTFTKPTENTAPAEPETDKAKGYDSAEGDLADKSEEIDAILAKYGCGAALGAGSLTALLALAAAAFTLRKKH